MKLSDPHRSVTAPASEPGNTKYGAATGVTAHDTVPTPYYLLVIVFMLVIPVAPFELKRDGNIVPSIRVRVFGIVLVVPLCVNILCIH